MNERTPSSQVPGVNTKGRIWAALPVVLLGTMLVGWGIMVAVALDDPSFAVERDYYQKGVRWDEHQAQEAKNVALGWRLSIQLASRGAEREVVAHLADREGRAIAGATVRLETLHVARAAQVREAVLVEGEPGSYRATVPLRRDGIWEMRFTVERGSDRFTSLQRLEAGGGG